MPRTWVKMWAVAKRRKRAIVWGCTATLWVVVLWMQHKILGQHFSEMSIPTTTTFEGQATSSVLPLREEGAIVGKFNQIPLRLRKDESLSSEIRCTESEHWMFRSCHYTNLCFDMANKDFVILAATNHEYEETTKMGEQVTVALGGINPRWDVASPGDDPSTKGSEKLKWFPRVVKGVPPAGYYSLPPDVVWVPFHSFASHNVGHLLWDDLYAIFRLLRQWHFQLGYQHMLLRQKISTPLYASCDIRPKKRKQCKKNFETFLKPLFGVEPTTFSSSHQFNVSLKGEAVTPLVCAKNGLVGIGSLTDHGLADHGWDFPDIGSKVPHNLGHARDFWDFGRWTVQHALGTTPIKSPNENLLVLFSLESSKDWDRRLDFLPYRKALNDAVADRTSVDVRAERLWELSIVEQVQLTASADVLIATCGGGGALPVTFLSRGSSMIVFYNPSGGYNYEAGTKQRDWPVQLDWDLLQHAAAHVRVHWFPIRTTHNDLVAVGQEDLDLFIELVLHELDSEGGSG